MQSPFIAPAPIVDTTKKGMYCCNATDAVIYEEHTYEKTEVIQNKSNLLLKNQMYNTSTSQLIQLKMV